MLKIFKASKLPDYFSWSTIALALFPILSVSLRSNFTIIWCVVTFAAGLYGNAGKRSDLIYWMLPIGLFLMFTASLVYTDNLPAGLFVIEKSVPLAVFPLMLFWNKLQLKNKHFDIALTVYVAACFLLACYLLGMYIFSYESDPSVPPHFEEIQKRQYAEQITGTHPTYLSTFILFAGIICIDQLSSRKSTFFQILGKAFIIVVFIGVSMLLAARMPMIAFVVTLFFQLLVAQWSLLKKLMLVAVVLGILVLSIIAIPTIRQRALETIETKYELPEGEHFNSTNLRVGIFHCTKEILEDHYFLGTGVGDAQSVLNNCLHTLPTDAYRQIDYNTHNQFLGVWVKTGLPGLFLLLAIFVVGLWFSYRERNFLLAMFLIFSLICFQTEELLSRQAGITFFMYFYILLKFSKSDRSDWF
ncbi:O-antigen ligase [Cesiribacter sp. SM1]|uniref:O-antigen ligase family protein n=1 Tax=Cesiribacter sp. SM1 TaxID=2861196 RepID=UPI001CD3F9AA|nr:O-antigen ligase family protein [Cesiribacter sp. SM1]